MIKQRKSTTRFALCSLGFTLAEVLITLGIIGVVAVLTLPNVMANHRNKTLVTQLQRAYNQISNAFEHLMMDESTDNLFETSLFEDNGTEQFFKKYFKTTKICDEREDCFASEYKSPSGTVYRVQDLLYSGTKLCTLNTGAVLQIIPDIYSDNDLNSMIKLSVDVNGKAGPNIIGRDLFLLKVNSKGDVFDMYNDDSDVCQKSEYAGCFQRITNNGWVMDY